MNGNACPLVSELEQQAKDNRKRDCLLNTQSATPSIWPYACHLGRLWLSPHYSAKQLPLPLSGSAGCFLSEESFPETFRRRQQQQ